MKAATLAELANSCRRRPGRPAGWYTGGPASAPLSARTDVIQISLLSPSAKADSLAYRLASYWLPLPAGLVGWVLHRRRYGTSAEERRFVRDAGRDSRVARTRPPAKEWQA